VNEPNIPEVGWKSLVVLRVLSMSTQLALFHKKETPCHRCSMVVIASERIEKKEAVEQRFYERRML
jgi:hypothetical protein